MRRILITGVAGFVGSNLASHLLVKGYQVTGIDVSDRHGRLAAQGLLNHPGFAFESIDIAEHPSQLAELAQCSAIVHLAALPHVDYSYFYPRQTIENNTGSLLAAIECALKWDVPLIFSSSVECYGGRRDTPYKETDAPLPLSPYAASKVAGEAIVASYVETQGLRATILRFTNLYGPWQAPDRLIPRVIAQALQGKNIVVEKGTHRDFVFIADACAVLEKALVLPHKGELYNLCSGVRTDNFEAVHKVLSQDLAGTKLTVRQPKARDGRGRFLIADPNKLQTALDWRPEIELAEGARLTVEWNRQHLQWLAQFTPFIEADRTTDAFLTDRDWAAIV